jgi:hypothetical protein
MSLEGLREVLAKKASELTEQDITITVNYLRESRAQFAKEEVAKASKPKKEKGAAPNALSPEDLKLLGF